MIIYIIYLLLLSWLIYKNRFVRVFKSDNIATWQYTALFVLKALAVPVFYWVYQIMYGGLDMLDAGKFYKDATLIGEYAFKDPMAYLRVMFGLQNDNSDSADFANFLGHTYNWDNGQLKDYLYNDNRVVIRIHSLFSFIAFRSYFAHALFNCFLGFVGIVLLHRALLHFFKGAELMALIVLCLFPSFWFYTGAMLKEGIAVFITGNLVFFVQQVLQNKVSVLKWLWFIFMVFLGLLLKPYLVLFTSGSLVLLLYLQSKSRIRHKVLVFVACLICAFAAANVLSMAIGGRSLTQAVERHRRIFSDAATGGIFLLNGSTFIRLPYDTQLVNKVSGKDSLYKIKAGVPYVYWKIENPEDTLYCQANADSSRIYQLVYMIGESRSNINPGHYEKGFLYRVGISVYYSLFYPLFFNASGALQWLVSFENLAVILALIISVYVFVRYPGRRFFVFVMVFICLMMCLLIGNATPNSGAISRYRSPVVIYLLLAALTAVSEARAKKVVAE